MQGRRTGKGRHRHGSQASYACYTRCVSHLLRFTGASGPIIRLLEGLSRQEQLQKKSFKGVSGHLEAVQKAVRLREDHMGLAFPRAKAARRPFNSSTTWHKPLVGQDCASNGLQPVNLTSFQVQKAIESLCPYPKLASTRPLASRGVRHLARCL